MARLGSTTSARARQMRRALAQWERSGLTLKEFGRRRGIAASTLSWWRHVFRCTEPPSGTPRNRRRVRSRVTGTAPAFTEVPLAPSARSVSTLLEIVLRSGHVLRVPPGVPVGALRDVVAVLQGAAC